MIVDIGNGYRLGPWSTKDVPALTGYMNNKDVVAHFLDLPQPYGKSEASAWIKDGLAYHKAFLHHMHLCIRSPQGFPVGGIGKKLFRGGAFAHVAEIGYWVSPHLWGQGIATGAVKAYTAHLLHNEGFERIIAMPFVHNLASARVLDKCGYLLEGILNKFVGKNGRFIDAKLYAFLK
ncbi:MAG: GNAT family N-acetyltransferase [Bacteroidetes bacterium]|nr:GNAT family N-acetyltransferase [Bacteroidota bacterium]